VRLEVVMDTQYTKPSSMGINKEEFNREQKEKYRRFLEELMVIVRQKAEAKKREKEKGK